MKEAIFCISTILILPLALFISFLVDRLIDKSRRKKHPMYFEFYDKGMKICFDASAKTNHEAEFLKFQFKLLTEGLTEGECTEEYFKERFEYLANRHIKATKYLKEKQMEAEGFFKEADYYAKRNNLSWGVLY
jgi:hypothetical protein